MTDVLTVGALGSVLLARWKLIVAFVVLGAAAGVAYGMLAPATYTSKAVLFVIATPADKDGYYQAAQFAEKRAATYPALLNAPEVVERTRTALELKVPASALISMLTATNPTDSSLVEVEATAATPQLAQQLAGTAAGYLAEYAVELEDSGTNDGAVKLKMAVPARQPQSPSSPSPKVLGALGGMAGGALAVVVALSLHAWRRRPGKNNSDAAGPQGTAYATRPTEAEGHTASRLRSLAVRADQPTADGPTDVGGPAAQARREDAAHGALPASDRNGYGRPVPANGRPATADGRAVASGGQPALGAPLVRDAPDTTEPATSSAVGRRRKLTRRR